MKIAIYGVSRSGKDYLLERIIQHLKTEKISALHIKGSQTLDKLSIQKYNKKFKKTNEKQKIFLREEFTKIVDEKAQVNDVVFVDGHYAFITGQTFNVVFTEADKSCYDHFFYLDTKTEKILEFSRRSPKTKQDLEIQVEDINLWKEFEKKGLTEVCNTLKKELVILDEDTEICIQFISSWIKEYSYKFNYALIAKRIVEQVISLSPQKHNKVMLIDCDNTISENDITYDFCNFLGINKKELKEIFYGNRYSSYQFFKLQKLYQKNEKEKISEAIDFSILKILMNPKVGGLINNKKKDSYVIALTVGILEVWERKLKEKSINTIFGNTVKCDQNFFMTPLLKKNIAYIFKNRGFDVLSIGDSIIDIPMLEISDTAYIVAHKKINQTLLTYFEENPNTTIIQLFPGKYCYPIKQLRKEI